MSIEDVFGLTAIDPWFLHHIKVLVDQELNLNDLAGRFRPDLTEERREDLAETSLAGQAQRLFRCATGPVHRVDRR